MPALTWTDGCHLTQIRGECQRTNVPPAQQLSALIALDPEVIPRMHTALRVRVLVPLLLCGAATMVVKTASFGAARRLLAHTPNPIQPPHCPTHCPTGPKIAQFHSLCHHNALLFWFSGGGGVC